MATQPPVKGQNTAVVNVRCTPEEKKSWEAVFGYRFVSAAVRKLMNNATNKKQKHVKT